MARRDVELLHSESGGEGEEIDGETVRSSTRSFIRGLVAEGDRIIASGTHRVVVDQLVIPSDISSSEISVDEVGQ